jgi:proline iminopeptidase
MEELGNRMLKEYRPMTTNKNEEHLMEDHTLTINGVDLHYRSIGDGPVLFLVPPGWGIASGYLQRAFSSLSKHLRLVFIDTRGSGLSGRPVDAAHMGSVDMADDLEALRVHLDLSKVSILGHSNSGAIAPSYAARYPDRVNKLVLSGSQVLGLARLRRHKGSSRIDPLIPGLKRLQELWRHFSRDK